MSLLACSAFESDVHSLCGLFSVRFRPGESTVTGGHLSESSLTPFEFTCLLLLDPFDIMRCVGLAEGAVGLDRPGFLHNITILRESKLANIEVI